MRAFKPGPAMVVALLALIVALLAAVRSRPAT